MDRPEYGFVGLEVVGNSGKLHGMTCVGGVEALRHRFDNVALLGTCGIGYMRRVTHGAHTDANAHPHVDGTGRFVVALAGTIENHREIRRELEACGHTFVSQFDMEVVAHLIQEEWDGSARGDLACAVRSACELLEGRWALVVVSSEDPGQIVATRMGMPLTIILAGEGAYVASDSMPLASVAHRVLQLEDGVVVTLGPDGYAVRVSGQGVSVEHPAHM